MIKLFRGAFFMAFRSEADFSQAFSRCIQETHAAIDKVFCGIIENDTSNAAIMFSGDPVVVLGERFDQLCSFLDTASEHSFSVNSSVLGDIIVRVLKVQYSTPTRDKRIYIVKESLPSIHALAWRYLARWTGRLECVTGLVRKVPDWLRIFVTRYHVSLHADNTSGADLLGAIFEFLVQLSSDDGAHAFLCDGLARVLLDLVISTLPLVKKQDEKSTISAARSKHSTKRNKVEQDFQIKLKEVQKVGTTNSAVSIVETMLDWTFRAMNIASFQSSVPSATRSALIAMLCELVSSDHVGHEHLLCALSASILGIQPAIMSPHLPLLMQIITAGLNSPDAQVLKASKRAALLIDLTIRPRRGLLPGASFPAKATQEDALIQPTNAFKWTTEEEKLEGLATPVEKLAENSYKVAAKSYTVGLERLIPADATKNNSTEAPAGNESDKATYHSKFALQSITAVAICNSADSARSPVVDVGPSRPEIVFEDKEPLPELVDEGPDE